MKLKTGRALFSVMPTEPVLALGRRLSEAGWEIIATRDVCLALLAAHVPAVQVGVFLGEEDRYGFPPTLHPKMESALTRDVDYRIDLVFDVPYGLATGNDVGGHTLLALAAKGERLPVFSCEDLDSMMEELCGPQGVSDRTRKKMIAKANFEIARHYLQVLENGGNGQDPVYLGLLFEQAGGLLHGENPYQKPAYLMGSPDGRGEDPLSLTRFEQVAGNSPCYTNLADLDNVLNVTARIDLAVRVNRALDGPFFLAVAAKHGNACGAGAAGAPQDSLKSALWGSPQAVWGGELAVNFPITAEIAGMMLKSPEREKQWGGAFWMLDVIAAPAIEPEAVRVLSKNPNRKILINPALASPALPRVPDVRLVRGGVLVQPPADYVLDLKALHWTQERPPENTVDYILAWAVAYSANAGGNEVALAANGRLVGLGGGPSTVQAVRGALESVRLSGHSAEGAVFAADAFFPFADGPRLLADGGVGSGVVPAGGKQHKSIEDFFRKHKMKVGFIPQEFRGFCRH